MEEKDKHFIDLYVGKRIRYRRSIVGISQQKLADHVGIKFQQIQKYETGTNRVSASRLWDIANVLDVSITFFFDGCLRAYDCHTQNVFVDPDDKEAMTILRCYYAIPANKRHLLRDLLKSLSK